MEREVSTMIDRPVPIVWDQGRAKTKPSAGDVSGTRYSQTSASPPVG